MFIKEDLLGFFESMMELEVKQRDTFMGLAADIDDPDIKNILKRIGNDEQSHMGLVQRIIDLLNSVN
ncbi:MAG: hypothetical protein WCG19_06045 [Chlorobiaceae bacterium]